MYTFPLVFNPSNEIAARRARNIFYRVGEIFFTGSRLLSTYTGETIIYAGRMLVRTMCLRENYFAIARAD